MKQRLLIVDDEPAEQALLLVIAQLLAADLAQLTDLVGAERLHGALPLCFVI